MAVLHRHPRAVQSRWQPEWVAAAAGNHLDYNNFVAAACCIVDLLVDFPVPRIDYTCHTKQNFMKTSSFVILNY